MAPCPCGRSSPQGQTISFEVCCGQYHSGQAAPDAESLMRSRYSAFVLGDVPYLLATWHSSQRPATLELETGAKWLGLQVKEHRITGEHSAEVEFFARFRLGGKATRQRERSRFVREDGRWYYVDGEPH